MISLREFLYIFKKGHQKTFGKDIAQAINANTQYHIPNDWELIYHDIDKFYKDHQFIYRGNILKPNWYADKSEHFSALASNKLGFDETLKIFFGSILSFQKPLRIWKPVFMAQQFKHWCRTYRIGAVNLKV